MKKAMRILIISGLFLAIPIISLSQTPPHPNGGNAPGTGNTPVGGGTPIDGGLTVMLILGAAYGSKKAYRAFR